MSPAEAFAAIALVAVACDGTVNATEATLLRVQLEGRHPYQDHSEASMGLLFEGLLDQLHTAGWRELIRQAIPVLTARQRETALAMATHLIHGDRRVNAEEMGLLGELAERMDLPAGRAEQIVEAIALLHRDCLAPGPDALGDGGGQPT